METTFEHKFRQVGGDYGDPIEFGGIWIDDATGTMWALHVGISDMVDRTGENEGAIKLSFYRYCGAEETDVRAEFDWCDWNAIEDCCDSKGQTDPIRLFEDIGAYYGWDEIDSYPYEITVAEAKQLFGL